MAVNAIRLVRFGLNAVDPGTLAGFYERALGFARTAETTLRLGRETVVLTAVAPGGAPYPGDVPGWSPLFQHFAIIVSDMAAAYARLCATEGWRPISEGGPQRLPESSGGVTAFKFRDPEGHPLEFLAFPAGTAPTVWAEGSLGSDDPVCLGIDHSAVSVADSARSVRFYEGLGLSVSQRSHNLGPEQARLDAVADPDVKVTGLSLPDQAAPHVELLCYRGRYDRSAPLPALNDVAATRLVLEVDETTRETIRTSHAEHLVRAGPGEVLLRDPDGHLLQFVRR